MGVTGALAAGGLFAGSAFLGPSPSATGNLRGASEFSAQEVATNPQLGRIAMNAEPAVSSSWMLTSAACVAFAGAMATGGRKSRRQKATASATTMQAVGIGINGLKNWSPGCAYRIKRSRCGLEGHQYQL